MRKGKGHVASNTSMTVCIYSILDAGAGGGKGCRGAIRCDDVVEDGGFAMFFRVMERGREGKGA